MSGPTQTVEIEGFGPITIRGLTQPQVERLNQRPDLHAGQLPMDYAIYVLSRGLVSPELASSEALLTSPERVAEVVAAILRQSWGWED
jgi:hypothetical protein